MPVTIIEVLPNRVTRVLTPDKDGYAAVQVTTGSRSAARMSKPVAGAYARAAVEPGDGLWEFRATEADLDGLAPGAELKVDRFQAGQRVDVSGTTIGKGFSGAIKRHNFSSNRASHGNSISHNSAGSIGMAQDPGRVFPGKKMAGQYGSVQRTIQGLEVVRVDVERQLLLVKGAVPGAKGGDVVVRPAVKA